MGEKHFFAVHTFVSDEVRSQFVTPPEKRNPPEKRETEKEWVEKIQGKYARCVQTWVCLLYTSPSPRDLDLSRMPSSA